MSKLPLAVRVGLAATFLGAAAAGCGLLDDATKFTVETGWKTLTVDSSALGVTVPSGTTIPAVPCDQDPTICAQAGTQLACSSATYECALQCGQGGTCEIVASAEESQVIDISEKVKNQTTASALSKVSLQRVLYKVTESSLTFDTPKLEVFVGPQEATSTADAGVVRFATMPVIPAGEAPNGEMQDVTEAGKQALAGFVKNYQTPFKIFVRASLRFASGDPLPQGKISIQFNGFFEVEPV